MSSIECDEFDTDFINSASNVVKDNWKNQDNCNAPTKMILRSRTNDPKPSDDPIQIDLDSTITPPTSPHARGPDATVSLPTDTTTSSSSRVSTLIILNNNFMMSSNSALTQFVFFLFVTVNHDS